MRRPRRALAASCRPTPPRSCRVVLPICYRQITQLGDTSTNYQIKPGDRIYFPPLDSAELPPTLNNVGYAALLRGDLATADVAHRYLWGPIVDQLFADEQVGMLLWLPALVPAFLLTYYRGWRGVALPDERTMLAARIVAPDGIQHTSWTVSDPAAIEKFEKASEELPDEILKASRCRVSEEVFRLLTLARVTRSDIRREAAVDAPFGGFGRWVGRGISQGCALRSVDHRYFSELGQARAIGETRSQQYA